MPDVRSFGQRLREARIARGMSQVDLAGRDLSSSYISLIESDRRRPSAAMVQLLAERLDVAVDELTGATEKQRLATTFVEHLALARRALRDGDVDGAESLLLDAAAEAAAINDEAFWWTATRDLVDLYTAQQQFDAAHEALASLGQSPATQQSDWLAVDVATALSENLRARGRLAESVDAAITAVNVSTQLTDRTGERARALMALLAAQAERGDQAGARHAAEQLQQIVERVTPPRLRGAVHWALGNEAFLRGDAAAAREQHDLAFAVLTPRLDLRLWARLCRASAAMRLTAGIATEVVADLLARARTALELIGTERDLYELAITEGQQALQAGSPQRALELVAPVVDKQPNVASHDLALAHLVQARALRQLGETEAAAGAYRQAAEVFDAAGAYQRASQTWRELDGLDRG